MKVTIEPGDSLDIEIEGLGVMYSVLTRPTYRDPTQSNDVESVAVDVVDRANDVVIDVNEHLVDQAINTSPKGWSQGVVLVLDDGETYSGVKGGAIIEIPGGVEEADIDKFVKHVAAQNDSAFILHRF